MTWTKPPASARIILCDVDRCMGCRSCEIACALAHSVAEDLHEAILLDSPPQARVRVEAAGPGGLPIQCRHCQDAPCVAACPTEAIRREADASPVLIDPERCIGCRLCMIVCPFGVIEMARDGSTAVKCDLCVHRTDAGGEPACVAACPTRALRFMTVEQVNRLKRKAAAEAIRAESADSAP